MMILGKMSGSLMKFYKQMKKERAQEKDFAKGTCYFEDIGGHNPTMRIALDDGKGKPTKMKKNGKKLLKKLGLAVDIFKGDLGLEDENLEEEELAEIEEQVDEDNDDQKMKKIVKAYKSAFAMVAANVIPVLKAKEGITEQHYQLSLKLLKLSKSAQNKWEEINTKQQAKYADLVNDIKSRDPKVIKIAANLKKMLAESTVEGDLEEVHEELDEQALENRFWELIPKANITLKEKGLAAISIPSNDQTV